MTVGTSKVTQKGQVTIPADMRTHLGIEPGSSVIMIEVEDGILIRTESEVQEAFKFFQDAAKKAGITREDVDQAVAEVRREMHEERKKKNSST